MNWTKNQLLAIEKKTSDTLVSAAAGSGKTAALTERVIRSLCREEEPTDIKRLLIVTFTNKAADELKAKIRTKLYERSKADPSNASVKAQLLNISMAEISTIHSFYGRLVKDNFKSLGLPAKLRTADEGEAALLCRNVMDSVIDSFYDKPMNDGCDLDDPDTVFETLSAAKTDEKLADILIKLYTSYSSYPEHLEAIRINAETYGRAAKDFEDSPYMALIRRECADAEYFAELYEGLIDGYSQEELFVKKYAPAIYPRIELARALSKAEGLSYKELRSLLEGPKLPSLGSVRGEYEFKAETKQANEEFKDFLSSLKGFFAFGPEAVSDIMKRSEAECLALYKVLTRFHRTLTDEKLRLKIADFNDLERYAFDLLCLPDGTPTELALEYRERYDEIYVDEYQDTNRMQDLMFAAISKNNRFMVGDVKQSIYSFRGAVAEIFSDYRVRFGEKKLGDTVFMSDNFRCDKGVIDFSNLVFEKLFSSSGGISYTKEDRLVFSKGAPDGKEPSKVRFISAVGAEDSKPDPSAVVARVISEYVGKAKTDKGEIVTYGDVTVLCRKKSSCRRLEKELDRLGLPVYNAAHQSFFDSPEVLLTLSLLSAIDNPMRDIPLAAAMKSPVFGFTLDQLADISRDKGVIPLYIAVCKKAEDGDIFCREFTEKLSYFRYRAKSMPTDAFIRLLYKETLLESLIYNPSDGDGEKSRAANLRLLYELARNFESGSFKGLSDFVAYLNDMVYRKKKLDAAHGDGAQGKITIQTIHNSKGLEYPVCILADAEAEFNKEHTKKALCSDRELGLAFKVFYPETSIFKKGPAYHAVTHAINRSITREEIRLLYVALTRARDHLCIIGVEKSKKQPPRASSYNVYKQISHFALLRSALCDTKDPSFVRESYGPDGAIVDVAKDMPRHGAPIELLKDEIASRVGFVYPYTTLSELPKKISVSKLSPSALDPDDRETVDLLREVAAPVPTFMEEKHAPERRDRGISTHLFMQFTNLSDPFIDVREEAARLCNEGFIKESDAEGLYLTEIKQFFRSDIYRLMFDAMCSDRIFEREYRFNVRLDASRFTTDLGLKTELKGEKLLVQGVIDCFFENEDGTLTVLDYKTDRIREDDLDEFVERHRSQLSYYKDALERLTKRKVSKTVLYSFCLGRKIEVN